MDDALSEETYWTVAWIYDGDSFEARNNRGEYKSIRVAWIDCPEDDQPWGDHAEEYTRCWLERKELILIEVDEDKYERSISRVLTKNRKRSLGKDLLKNGHAWHFIWFSSDSLLQACEDSARKHRLGLWKDSLPIPPWIWRSQNEHLREDNFYP